MIFGGFGVVKSGVKRELKVAINRVRCPLTRLSRPGKGQSGDPHPQKPVTANLVQLHPSLYSIFHIKDAKVAAFG